MKNAGTIEFFKVEVKEGKTWKETYRIDETMKNGKEEIYKRLMHGLIAKKLHGCTYIKSIKRRQPYDGTEEITITFDNNTREFYKVEF